MNKETLKGLGGLLLIVLVGFGVYFLVNYGEQKNVKKQNEAKVAELLREGFMSGCVTESSFYTFCSCSFDKLLTTWGADKFVNISLEYNVTGKLPDGTVGIISECTK
jgi:hypothetical protein